MAMEEFARGERGDQTTDVQVRVREVPKMEKVSAHGKVQIGSVAATCGYVKII